MCVIRDLKTLSEMYTTKMLTKEEFVILKEMTIKEAIKKDRMSSETTSEETTSTQTAEGSQHTAAESPSVNEAADDEAADDEAADDEAADDEAADDEAADDDSADDWNFSTDQVNLIYEGVTYIRDKDGCVYDDEFDEVGKWVDGKITFSNPGWLHLHKFSLRHCGEEI